MWQWISVVTVAALLVGGLSLANPESRAQSAAGPYQIAAPGDGNHVWQLNTTTGRLRMCVPPPAWPGPPDCGPWRDSGE